MLSNPSGTPDTAAGAAAQPKRPAKPRRKAVDAGPDPVAGAAAQPKRPAKPRRKPSSAALELAADAAERAQNRSCPIRVGFIERAPDSEKVPMAELLRGGQGGSVRLKLYLSMLWMAGKAPHDTSYPARVWATLLDLPQPDTNGARRVTAAISWLERHDLIKSKHLPGLPAKTYLLDERQTGAQYQLPGDFWKEREELGEELTRSDYWVKLPPEFWTKGWIATLDAPAIAMWLALMVDSNRYKRQHNLWFSDSQGQKRFDLSIDTRNHGLRELESVWLVESKKQSISRSSFDYRKMRKTYTLRFAQLAAGQDRHVLDWDADFAGLQASVLKEVQPEVVEK